MSQLVLGGIKQLDEHIGDLEPRIVDTYPVNQHRWDASHETVQMFDTAQGWSVQGELDTEVTFEDRPTMRFHSDGGSTIGPRFNFGRSVDFSDADYIDVWVRFSRPPEPPESINIRFSKDDWSVENSVRLTPWAYTLPVGEFVMVRVNLRESEEVVPWTDVGRFRIHYAVPDGLPMTMHIARMDIVKVDRAVVCISFDDHHDSVYNPAFQIMSQYGLAGAFYINTSRIGDSNAVTWDQLREMRDRGWVIGNHTHSHVNLADPNVSDDEKIQDIMRADAILKQQGFRDGASFFSYPYGQRPPTGGAVDTLLRSLTINRRLVNTETVKHSPVGGLYGDGLRGVNMGAQQTVQYAIDLIDEAIERKLYLEFLFHRIVPNPTESTQFDPDDFEAVCAYIAEKRDRGLLTVTTPADLYLQHTGEVVTVEGVDYIRSASATGRTLMLKLPG